MRQIAITVTRWPPRTAEESEWYSEGIRMIAAVAAIVAAIVAVADVSSCIQRAVHEPVGHCNYLLPP